MGTKTAQHLVHTKQLHNGTHMPLLGLGTWNMRGKEIEATRAALDIGYRHIDTAKIYGTEKGIGHAVRESGVPREDVWITTKLWGSDQGYESALRAIDVSLQELINRKMDSKIGRADLFISQTRDGELLITSRQDGTIRMLVPGAPKD